MTLRQMLEVANKHPDGMGQASTPGYGPFSKMI